MSEKSNWIIEYEIPPLRAIYLAEAENCTKQEAREMVAKEQPLWRIRKITSPWNGSATTAASSIATKNLKPKTSCIGCQRANRARRKMTENQ